jgi:hypothetical protein
MSDDEAVKKLVDGKWEKVRGQFMSRALTWCGEIVSMHIFKPSMLHSPAGRCSIDRGFCSENSDFNSHPTPPGFIPDNLVNQCNLSGVGVSRESKKQLIE